MYFGLPNQNFVATTKEVEKNFANCKHGGVSIMLWGCVVGRMDSTKY